MSLNRRQKELLRSFQCDAIRSIEEQFAQILTERSDVRVFFVNEDKCFTDGKNITIDPALRELFTDKKALRRAEKHLSMDDSISSDLWLALHFHTRALNIHESLHILYSAIPQPWVHDERVSSDICRIVLAYIHNVIEDAFIEAAGCSLYDNLEHYLLWNRIALFYTASEAPSTLEQRFGQAGIMADVANADRSLCENEEQNSEQVYDENTIKFAKLLTYLNYMGFLILYPFIIPNKPASVIAEYVEKTKELWRESAICGNSAKRSDYVLQIFDIIEPLIPNDDMILPSALQERFDNMKAQYAPDDFFSEHSSKGKEVIVTRRLFTDLNGEPISSDSVKKKLADAIQVSKEEKEKFKQGQPDKASTATYRAGNFDCSNMHQGVILNVTKPGINLNLRRAYQNKVAKFQLTINAHAANIAKYLKMNIETREEKKLFGSGISSKHLGDFKKRQWYRKAIEEGIPDIGFLFMIDGSGSMDGERMESVISAMVIIHEVFHKNNIQHSIVEHRAIYNKPFLVHNILVDFHYKNNEKFNILSLEADEGTREGFSLYWAEKHLRNNCSCERKIIVMISDGAPAHIFRGGVEYIPPVSIKDTAEAAKMIIRRGTPIIAVALDTPEDDDFDDDEDSDATYQQLKMIYPDVVSCKDVGKIAVQLLHLITKLFQGRFK
ncbi:MAG: hypothetical protein LBC99_05365 [Spirochaetota bacterium]|nr:hypothetical protein [Spirochaetota bacterium]